jgi:predicted SAM-dependent methyltransferase
MDVSSLQFDDETADLIYASHVLQYFDHKEAIDVLNEWRRVLKPHGICRVSVPDFRMLMKAYQFGLGMNWLLGSLYGRIPSGDGYIYHKTCYDGASLIDTFEKAGFSSVRWWDWRETEHADVDDYSQAYFPHMSKNEGLLWNLNMEAVK